MGLLDIFKRKTDKSNITETESKEVMDSSSTQVIFNDLQKDLGGARMTVPAYAELSGVYSAIPKKTQRQLGLTETKLRNYSIDQMLDILSETHPDVSYAVWNFVRLSNSGYNIQVKKLDDTSEYTKGEKAIKSFIEGLEAPSTVGFGQSRSIERSINQMLRTAIIRGAASVELVLSEDLMDASYITAVDPATVEFHSEDGRLVPWQMYPNQVKLDSPRFFYEGLDAYIDDPSGISPIVSAIQTIFFQLQVLQDLKAVVHNQGYPKYDIKIIEKVLLERMPTAIRNDNKKKQEWLNDKMTEIITMYNKLQPDDAFVHFDSTEVNMPDAGKAMLDPEKLMNVINEQLNMAVKSLSTIMGRRSNGNTETFAKVEIKLYLKGIEDIQWLIESIMSRALTLVLNFQGLQGIVKFKFKPVEIRTALEQEQFRTLQIQNYANLADLGWISEEEACIAITGDKPSGTPNPNGFRLSGKSGTTDERQPGDSQNSENK